MTFPTHTAVRRAVGLVLLVLAAGCRAKRPNVLLISIDTLRVDRVGAYGYKPAHTPNLDRLAREGVRCADAVTAAPITLPSHSTILTGLLPPAHGVRDNGTYALPDRAVTLAERLKAVGYETRAFVSAAVLNRRYNLTQGFDSYDDDLWAENAPTLFMIRDRKGVKTAGRFLAWLDGRPKGSSETPFFVWMHLFDPHQPYEPAEIDRRLVPTLYDAEISGADRAVGMAIDALQRKGMLDNTIVVMTADHGESLGEHNEKTHAIFVYDATMHIPMLFRYPKELPAGRVYPGPVRTIDIVPTILAILRLPGGETTQGVNLLDAFAGRTPAPQLPQYIESLTSELGFGMAPLVGLRAGGWKWIRAPRPELYDLAHDPHELLNLYPAQKERAGQLDRQLEGILQDSRKRSLEATANPMNRETMETMLSLGYLTPREDRKSMGGMDPKDGIGIYNDLDQARHFAQRRKWGAAQRLLLGILEKIPGHVSARNVLALTYLRQGELEAAERQYRLSLKTDPGQARVHSMLGTIALLQDRDDDATREFQAALAITPGFIEAMDQLGLVASLRGDSALAGQWYAKAMAADPGFPRSYKLFADLLYERRDYAKALEQYRRVLTISPRDFPALLQAGACARRLGDTAGALEYFHWAERIHPHSWIPAYNEACLAATQGHTDEALTLLETARSRGLDDRSLIETDVDLAGLRSLPRFQRLLPPPESEE